MSQADGALPVNIKHLNELSAKLDAAANASCDSIQHFFDRGLKGLQDLIASMIKEIADLTTWADLIDFNPFSFIKKLIKKIIGPALASAITYAVQLALLLKAIINLISAVQRLVQKVIGCVVSNIARLSNITNQLTGALKGALAKIINIKAQLQLALKNEIASEVNGVLTFINQAKANAIAQVNEAQTPDFGDGSGSKTNKRPSVTVGELESANTPS